MSDTIIPLSKDTWIYVCNFLTKNDIACLKGSCQTLNTWIGNHPKLLVSYIGYEFWKDLIDSLSGYDEDRTYYGDEYCVLIDSIDRGIKSFTKFAKCLKEAYPNIKELDFEQNYSYLWDYISDKSDDKTLINFAQKEFVNFIAYLELTYLKMCDFQSSFFNQFDWNKILDAMPHRSEYIILCDTSSCELNSRHFKKHLENNEKCYKILTKETKRLIIHYH